MRQAYSVKVSSYAKPSVDKGVALPGQPVEHWYFHRSISDILRPFFDHGWVLDAFEEPLVDPEHGSAGSPGYVYTEVPGVLVVRLRARE